MSTINFYLKKANKNGQSLILLTYQNKGEKFRYFTRLKVKSICWGKQRVKNNYAGYAQINGILDDLENTIREIEREALFYKKEYNVETIKRKFFIKLGCITHENDFLKIYDSFINDARSTKSKATIQTYEATKVKLMDYMTDKGQSVTFENINQGFYEAFLNYMIIDKKHLNNTVGKHIKTLKVFLNYATDHEFTNLNFNLKRFKVFREESDIVYLTEDELMKLYNLKELTQTLMEVKDIFCFSCFTGLRFSDINKLRNAHIKTDYLEIRAEKTKDFLKIPLNVYSKEIIKKYENRFSDRPLPTGLTNQKTNEYLKEIGSQAKLNEQVTIEKFSGSNKVVITRAKSEFLCSHTARRTFVTLALEKGIRAEVVMAMTGHKNYKTFKKYIKITDKVMQNEMNRVWSIPLLKVV